MYKEIETTATQLKKYTIYVHKLVKTIYRWTILYR
jgi:hypothetical protein